MTRELLSITLRTCSPMHLFFPRDIESDVIETDIPGRLDRLPWSKWHWLIVIALGITWVLDGLEVTLAGAIGGVLRRPDTLGLSDTQVGASATFYLIGAVCGALLFGYLTDLLGRKKLFMVTLLLYLVSTALTAFSWSFASYAVFRALTGAGIGGEYSAINSAIDELIPARVRGTVDLIINSTFWIGAALGSVGTIVLLDKGWVSVNLGWRLAFGIGAVLGCTILILRHWVPESPRWLIIHGHQQEAERTMAGIEQHVVGSSREAAQARIHAAYSDALAYDVLGNLGFHLPQAPYPLLARPDFDGRAGVLL